MSMGIPARRAIVARRLRGEPGDVKALGGGWGEGEEEEAAGSEEGGRQEGEGEEVALWGRTGPAAGR
jgi:hypothetical protein